ncbi:hypothetical protein EGK68_05465 [Enterobacter cloacae]|uniref:Uncharacterized protein n=1 Tax=Enterobacter cloacae TaxID=550 RepID=A0A3R8ZCV2_ENTCL|nr:hypothetical protein EGK68_05465 [Enterobacter cloacae]
MICIKHVCDFFDSEQSKKTRVHTTGAGANVNPQRKNLINYSTKTVKYTGRRCRARREITPVATRRLQKDVAWWGGGPGSYA